MSRQVIETLISRQLHRYNRLRSLLKQAPADDRRAAGPVVTVSRMAGCCARELASLLAARLDVQVWGRELVDLIATDQGLRHELVSQLDRGEGSGGEAWVRGLLSGRMFVESDYVHALAQTLGALAESGGAVIVGRGAAFILGDRADLRLRLVAGAEHRIRVLARERAVGEAEAHSTMLRLDAAREEFVRSHFRRDVHDVRHYDLVANVERTPVPVLADACLTLIEARRRHRVREAGA
jgi:hypothetical protein